MRKPEVVVLDPGAKLDRQTMINERARLTQEGELFLSLVRTGMMMSHPTDYLLPNGDQKVTVMAPADVLSRALALTKGAFIEIDVNKWTIDIPSWPGECVEKFGQD